jgi:hypothetical protein
MHLKCAKFFILYATNIKNQQLLHFHNNIHISLWVCNYSFYIIPPSAYITK